MKLQTYARSCVYPSSIEKPDATSNATSNQVSVRCSTGGLWINTGNRLLINTFSVSLPNSCGVSPFHPCDAIKMRSHLSCSAALTIAICGALLWTSLQVHGTSSAMALLAIKARYSLANFSKSASRLTA